MGTYLQLYVGADSRVMTRVMVFNATFNNISVVSWWSVLLVEETGVPGDSADSILSECTNVKISPKGYVNIHEYLQISRF